MKVREQDVSYVADLANLELTGDERAGMVRDLNSILGYMDRLNELDTSEVPPMTQLSVQEANRVSGQHGGDDGNAARDDMIEGLRKSLAHDVALANAPDSDGAFFRVPKVIER